MVGVSVSVCVCLSPNHDTCATTAEPIKTPFGAWTWVGRRNHGGGPDPPREEVFFVMWYFVKKFFEDLVKNLSDFDNVRCKNTVALFWISLVNVQFFCKIPSHRLSPLIYRTSPIPAMFPIFNDCEYSRLEPLNNPLNTQSMTLV